VVFPLSMCAEIPMFRSFEKSVYTSYLHLRGGPSNMGESVCGALAGHPAEQHGRRSFEPVARRWNF
jgi:hypothetical protein